MVMNIASLLVRTRCSVLSRSLTRRYSLDIPPKRNFATHRDTEKSSLLSQSLDTKQHVQPRDSVGPFQLGLPESSLRKRENIRKWSELTTSGKVMRTTARTTNLTVILMGAGLSVLLLYSLTSELFSKNSPTVLYNDACERIKASPKVAKYLHGPLSFHNNPPSAIRPRHRNRHVISQVMIDAYGREHMIMTFYVQGRPPTINSSSSELSYFDIVTEWLQERASGLSDLTLDESLAWSQERVNNIWDRTKRLFKYLSGTPLPPPPPLPSYPPGPLESQREENSDWSVAGMFSSLKGAKGGRGESKQGQESRVYTDGQAHASFIRNQDGYFVIRYLLVDIPNSRDSNPVRVFVERTPGVRDNEPVMRWNPT